MIIVSDTNVIQNDFYMNSGRFEILFDYVNKTHSKFIMPKIVFAELAANYERELLTRFNQFLKTKKALSLVTQTQLPEISATERSHLAKEE